VRDLKMAFNAAIIVLLAVSAYGESAAPSAGPPSSGNPVQLFDPTRNAWPALPVLHLSRALFCTMEFKRSRSPIIFAPSLYQRYGPDGWMTAVWRFAGIGHFESFDPPECTPVSCHSRSAVDWSDAGPTRMRELSQEGLRMVGSPLSA
jgi:hypothetical protein